MIGATTAFVLVAAGCSGDDDVAAPDRRLPDVELASALRRFDSCDQLRTWAVDELAPRVGAYGLGGPVYTEVQEDLMARDTAAAPTAGDGGSATTTPSFSTTNVQVEGVDEPDSVKTDGTRIVAVAGSQVYLVSADQQRVLDGLDIGMYDGQLLLAGDRVLVIGTDTTPVSVSDTGDSRIGVPQYSGTRVVEVDITGETLALKDQFVLDGQFVSARMTGDVARIVMHADPQQRIGFVTPASPGDDAAERAEASNRQAIQDAPADAFLPRWWHVDADKQVLDEGTMLGCEDAHAPATFAGFGMVTVLSVDIGDGLGAGIAAGNGTGVMAGGQIVYSSADHLYVAAPEWVDWQQLSEADLRAASERHGTDIHRFDITDPAHAEYELSGHVDGELLNQFAMDEHDGMLRVATTTGSQFAGTEVAGTEATPSESQVVVLAPRNGELAEVGKVGGLGKTESIQAVRFLGDVAYVVTFRQTDPLYTIDLSDDANPRVAGELKVLGFSAYLHPVGDGRIIGIGQDATEEGQQLGTQVALFDVRDPAAPTRIAQATLADSSTAAQWDHHAFLWWAQTGLVAVPLSSYTSTPFAPTPFEGIVGFHVDVDAGTIAELGRVTHPGTEFGVDPQPLPVEPLEEPATSPSSSEASGAAPVDVPVDGSAEVIVSPTPIKRTLVVGDRLWTLSDAGFGVSDVATLGQTSFVPFN
jgi:uncharacterized secreted protein with C-terminal beta-propeller domain